MLTTAILFLGHSISVAHSHGIFETSLEEIDFLLDVDEEPSLDIRVTNVVNPRKLLSRRAEQTVSQQCIDDMKGWGPGADKYNEYKTVTNNLIESCPEATEYLNINETDSSFSMEVQMDMANCNTSELRAFCDEYFTLQALELQPMVVTCGRNVPSNATGELIPAVVTFYSYDIIDCVPKSCPSDYADWTIEDMELSMDISTGANCTIELMEGEGVEKESVTPVNQTSAPMDPTPSAASQLRLSWTFTLFALAATASVALLMMW